MVEDGLGIPSTASAAAAAAARLGGDCVATHGRDSSYIVVGDLQAARAVQAGARFLSHAPPASAASTAASSTGAGSFAAVHADADLPPSSSSSSSFHGLLSDPTVVDAAWHLLPSAAGLDATLGARSASPSLSSAAGSSLPARQPLVVVKFYASWCRACRGVLPPVGALPCTALRRTALHCLMCCTALCCTALRCLHLIAPSLPAASPLFCWCNAASSASKPAAWLCPCSLS